MSPKTLGFVYIKSGLNHSTTITPEQHIYCKRNMKKHKLLDMLCNISHRGNESKGKMVGLINKVLELFTKQNSLIMVLFTIVFFVEINLQCQFFTCPPPLI